VSTWTLICACAEDGTIGHDGRIPWHLPADLARFRSRTMGGLVIVGRRTAETLPPLPGRAVLVLGRDDLRWPGMAWRSGLARDWTGPVWVAGGAETYAALERDCDRMELTHVPGSPGGDTRWTPTWALWREVAREVIEGAEVVSYERRRG